jgi:protein SCO1/2
MGLTDCEKRPNARRFLALVFLLIFLSGYNSVTSVAVEPATGFKNPLFDVTLQDQDGQALPLAKYKGKTLLINFVYTTCDTTCPVQTKQLVEVQRKLSSANRKTIQFLSVTVDPERDTSATLKLFAETMGADLSDWTFATGTKEVIAELTKQLYVYAPRQAKPQLGDHSNQLYLYDKHGLFRQRYNGAPIDIPRLAKEIQELNATSDDISLNHK